ARMTDRSAIDSSTDAEKTDLRPSQPRRNTAPPPQRATNRDFFSSLLGGFDSPSTGTQETSPVMVTLNGSIWKHPPLLACQKVSTVNSQPKSTLLEQCKNCELKHPSSEKLHRRIGGRRPTRHADRAPSIATTATRTAEVNFRCSRGKDFVRAPRAAADASKR
ncbi:MAG: hypothetical protein ACK5U4_25515, partial [Rhodospirillales bacterium]